MASFIKDPDSTLDYRIDWKLWLDGDIITQSSWIVPAGLALETSVFEDLFTTVWLSGGTLNTSYEVVNRISTQSGRIEDRTITIKIRSK